MKIIIIGDIHGRKQWKNIVNSEKFDKVVFLGDYFSSHEGLSGEQQIDNYLDILQCKKDNPKKVILLRGNHDMQHLGYYWAECCNFFNVVQQFFNFEANKTEFLENTQWLFKYKNILMSHAGVSKVWMNNSGLKSVSEINNLPPSEIFGFIPSLKNPYDYYGNSDTQPLTWIRPDALVTCAVKKYTQIVGHTRVKNIFNVRKYNEENPDIWLCDCMPKEYLVYDNGKFVIKNIDDI